MGSGDGVRRSNWTLDLRMGGKGSVHGGGSGGLFMVRELGFQMERQGGRQRSREWAILSISL